jgi:pimeloyl-ACP methyl ester carboxylesterase
LIQEVVLVPGLWMPAGLMALMAARLGRAGYATHCFSYRGREPVQANIDRLVRYIDGRPVHFVGHSLGGVLIYDLLSEYPSMLSGHVVLIGSPVRGCFAGRRLGSAAIGRWMLGACAERWSERDAVWRRREPLGVIAGTRALGLGRALGALPGENDGVVRVDETIVEGMTERVLLPQGHSMLPVSRRVAGLVQSFISSGRFA